MKIKLKIYYSVAKNPKQPNEMTLRCDWHIELIGVKTGWQCEDAELSASVSLWQVYWTGDRAANQLNPLVNTVPWVSMLISCYQIACRHHKLTE